MSNETIAASPSQLEWEQLDRLRQRQNFKWQKFGPDALPAWVADTDVIPSPVVREALKKALEANDFGYPCRFDDNAERAVQLAFAGRMQRRFGWAVDPDHTVCVNDVIQAVFASLMAFSEPGEGVVLHMPSYPPFRIAMNRLGLKLVASELVDAENGYQLDLDALKAKIDPRTRTMILCNPHNPTGRVFTKDELLALGQIAIDNDMIIIADEIHADLVFDGHKHIPISSLSEELAARTVTLTSSSKSFGMPALRCGIMHFGSAELLDRFNRRIPAQILGHPNILGIEATAAAWNNGDAWVDEFVAALQINRDHVCARLGAEAPAIKLHKPNGTFMAFLDCSGLRLNQPAGEYLLSKGVACSNGEDFSPEHSQFVRLNYATSPAILDQILDRIVSAAGAAK